MRLRSYEPMAASPAIVEAAEGAGLRYVSDASPGIRRERRGRGFAYRMPDGSLVSDPKAIDRIRRLAIPPAYRDVWISTDPHAHLQATGFDARGRKQYRYHPRFREVRDENKFRRMLAFGRCLPALRARVDDDLARKGLPREKVLAVVVHLLERSLIRVGNEEYARTNRSFGLTTLRSRHVRIAGERIEFNFLGKSGIKHRIEVQDRRLARIVKRLQELPGQELFRYIDDEGSPAAISSADVNDYLQGATGEHFTAKDFRTWWGSLLALIELGNQDLPAGRTALKRAVMTVMKTVSSQLGNTPAICRKCYVHPAVLRCFESGGLRERLSQSLSDSVEDLVVCAESTLLELLECEEKALASEQAA